MTDAQKHAARLREIAADLMGMDNGTPDATSLLAGAEALEAQGRWVFRSRGPLVYLVPEDMAINFDVLRDSVDAGDWIAPEWAKPVSIDNVVITGWER